MYIRSGMFSFGLTNFLSLSDRMSDMLKKFSTSLLMCPFLRVVFSEARLDSDSLKYLNVNLQVSAIGKSIRILLNLSFADVNTWENNAWR